MELESQAFNNLRKYTKALSVALGYRDLSTRLHSERVQGLAVEIGMSCGLSQNEINILHIAASLHDIGKIGISDKLLSKPAQFDETEWEIMKQHAEIGAEILASTGLDGAQEATVLIRHHHEHYSGTGYPDRLRGEDIPVCARIISIADSYDAMAVTRSYHRARPHEEIMAIMQAESGKKYDPDLIRIFCDLIDDSEFKAMSTGQQLKTRQ